MLNSVLHHEGLSFIISSNNQTKYESEENNPDWFNKGTWYIASIYSKLYWTVFADFIINVRRDRYNLMCYITENDKQQPTYVDYASSGGGREITKSTTTASL